MGVLGTSSAVGLSDKKPVAMLPAGSTLQGNAPLLAGVRTGFCGSLTTFSAWQLQNVLLLVGGRGRDGGQWAQALWSVVIGMMTALASLVAGHHVAITIARHKHSSASRNSTLPVRRSFQSDSIDSSAADRFRGDDLIQQPRSQPMGSIPRGLIRDQQCPTAAPAARDQQRQPGVDNCQLGLSGSQLVSDEGAGCNSYWQQPLGKTSALQGELEAHLVQERGPRSADGTKAEAQETAQWPMPGRPTPEWTAGNVRGRNNRDKGEELMVEEEEDLGIQEEGPQGADEAEEEEEQREDAHAASEADSERPGRRHVHTAVHAAVGVLCAALTASFVTAAIVDNDDSHSGRRSIWLAILLGVPGAVLRWMLADLNFKLPGRASWLPAGTLVANSLAVIVEYALQIPEDRGPLRMWPATWVIAVQSGFCGALSTVSTFVNELIQIFRDEETGHRQGYLYMALTFALAWALGILVYGTAHWR